MSVCVCMWYLTTESQISSVQVTCSASCWVWSQQSCYWCNAPKVFQMDYFADWLKGCCSQFLIQSYMTSKIFLHNKTVWNQVHMVSNVTYLCSCHKHPRVVPLEGEDGPAKHLMLPILLHFLCQHVCQSPIKSLNQTYLSRNGRACCSLYAHFFHCLWKEGGPSVR